MNPISTEFAMEPNSAAHLTSHPVPNVDDTVRLPLALGARVANILYTTQFQMAYACAINARKSAERAIASIEASWPASPIRELTLDIYRAQARSADAMAHEVLAGARRNCGLAFAQYGYGRNEDRAKRGPN